MLPEMGISGPSLSMLNNRNSRSSQPPSYKQQQQQMMASSSSAISSTKVASYRLLCLQLQRICLK